MSELNEKEEQEILNISDEGGENVDDEQLAALHEARNNIDNFSEETVKEFRRRFTADFFGKDAGWDDLKNSGGAIQ